MNDKVIKRLAERGVEIIALRCAGFNNRDLGAAKENNIKVCRVPSYSPHGVAEHAVAMTLTLNRKTHKAYNRVREQNFFLSGLLGFDLAVISGLKTCKRGYVGVDVDEQEEKIFFRDLSGGIIQDDIISRLMSFPNVLITAHQNFFTEEALTHIASITLKNVKELTNSKNVSLQGALLA